MHNFVEKTNWNNNYGERESSKYIYIFATFTFPIIIIPICFLHKVVHQYCFKLLLRLTAPLEKLTTKLVQNVLGKTNCITGNMKVVDVVSRKADY